LFGRTFTKPGISTGNEIVKGTAYVKPEKTLIALGNFSDSLQTVQLGIDWAGIGMNAERVKLSSPFINNIQTAAEWQNGQSIPIEPRKGLIIVLESER